MMFFNSCVILLLSISVTQVCTRMVARSSFSSANGREAQRLNEEFQTLSGSSSCDDGDQACVNGAFGICQDGEFVTTECQEGTSCFALPLVSNPGTVLVCDTEEDATARIAATGVEGGLTGND